MPRKFVSSTMLALALAGTAVAQPNPYFPAPPVAVGGGPKVQRRGEDRAAAR